MRSTHYRFRKSNPDPRAVCDRCGFVVNHSDLREQMDFRGGESPVPTGILVCGRCEDKPQPFFARPRVKQDPTPVRKPRPVPPIIVAPFWILATGSWRNDGVWINEAVWR